MTKRSFESAFKHHQTMRSMACRLCRALPPTVDIKWLIEAGWRGLSDWCRDGGSESMDTVVRKALLNALQTDERMPAHIRQGFADVTNLKIPTYPEPVAI